jgi:hypothetical protein
VVEGRADQPVPAMGRLLTALVALAILAGAAPAPKPAPFSVMVEGFTFTAKVASLTVVPGEEIGLVIDGSDGPYRLEAKYGAARQVRGGAWRWRAPETPGLVELTVEDGRQAKAIAIQAFVMVPFGRVEKGRLQGYQIGTYPAKTQPEGFVEVTAENVRTKLSPHFELRQFLCKQAAGYPKYVVLSEALILKLERVIEALDRAGHDVDTLHVMSGYRTPYYNEQIGNVRDSQHTAGTAADVFVDEKTDGRMDDLNGDGVVTRDDAIWLFELVDRMDRLPDALFKGGLGDYGSTAAHGPFVHVDVRGRLARWRG